MRRPKAVNDISSSGNDNSVDFKVEMLEKEVNKLKLALFDLKHGELFLFSCHLAIAKILRLYSDQYLDK